MRPSFDFYVFTETLELHLVTGIYGFFANTTLSANSTFLVKGGKKKIVNIKEYSFNF